ncbi:MAG: ribonuclease P protein component [Chloroflexi bacterium]|nr:ribonuclease P protein component [Chloroflexota bacterium]
MVDRRYRLREEHDVKRVRSRGRSVAQGALVLRYMPNNTEPAQNRYTVIAGKKCGNAVHRNRLKRIVREALRAWHPVLKPGYDVAFICRGGTSEMPDLPAAQDTLQKILNRTDLLKPGEQAPAVGEPVTTSWKIAEGERE